MMHSRSIIPLLSLAALVLAAAGCGRVAAPHYVRDVPVSTEDARGLPLDQVYYASGQVEQLKNAKLVVRVEDPNQTIQPELSKINPKLNEEKGWWEKWRIDFERHLARKLRESGAFADVQGATYKLESYKPDAEFRVAVTEWHEGNKWLRAYFGPGLGSTRVQWEGVITDLKTGKPVFAFANASLHPGGPAVLGFPFKVWRGPQLIAEDLRFSSNDLAKALKRVIETPPTESAVYVER